jgi:hypothetical protein
MQGAIICSEFLLDGKVQNDMEIRLPRPSPPFFQLKNYLTV